MMMQEFIDRTGFTPTFEEYKAIEEPCTLTHFVGFHGDSGNLLVSLTYSVNLGFLNG